MKRVFVDTSALLALLISHDQHHTRAGAAFEKLRVQDATLVCSSYVLIETYALLARRVGLDAVKQFRQMFVPLFETIWITEPQHDRALDLVLDRNKRDLSLVDASSFVVMSERKIDDAFAYDKHFIDEGFLQFT